MKKLFAGIVTAIIVLSFGMTVFAAESVAEQNGRREINVHAKAVFISPDNMYDMPASAGKASITTKNGVVISINADSNILEGLTLNVIEMVKEDNESYSWISGIMSGLCDKFTAYDIYFTDKDGSHFDVRSSVTVAITTPNNYTNLRLYHIGSSANAEKIASKQSGGKTVFTVNEFSYYVLADEAKGDNGTVTTDPINPSNNDSPKTGDTSNMLNWLAVLLVSGDMLAVIGISKKLKKARGK